MNPTITATKTRASEDGKGEDGSKETLQASGGL